METIECIKARRSIRKYLDKGVSDEIIKKLIDLAEHAPYGKKESPDWEFIIIKDKKIKEKLMQNDDERKMLVEAPVVIVVCTDLNKDPVYRGGQINASLAAENLMLAAHNFGLGTCWVTAYPNNLKHVKDHKQIAKDLGCPKNIKPVALICVGYPDPREELEERKLRKVEEIIHYNTYRGK